VSTESILAFYAFGIVEPNMNTGQEKDWLPREYMVVGGQNEMNEPLVARNRFIRPPVHIKLGLMKQFQRFWIKSVRALNT
jgi:hypothetical protein